MRLDVYVNYRGTCEQAFRFYEQHLGGRITGMVRHGEQPNPGPAADWKEKILHARIEIGTTVLMGADIPQAEPMRSAYLTLSLDREEDAERVYEAYSSVAPADVGTRLEQRRKVVLLWDREPTTTEREFLYLCTLDAQE